LLPSPCSEGENFARNETARRFQCETRGRIQPSTPSKAHTSSKVSAAITAAEQERGMSGDFDQDARTLKPKDGRTKKEIADL